MQECAMSRRMLSLHCGRCALAMLRNGCMPDGKISDQTPAETYQPFTNNVTISPFWVFTPRIGRSAQCPGHALSRKSVLQYGWFSTLDCYDAKLSFPEKDTFRAIQAIGLSLQQLTGDRFHHGTLDNTLLLSLLWSTRSDYSERKFSHHSRWHWSSTREHRSFRTAIDIYEHSFLMRHLPLAYPFMSDSCEQLGHFPSNDFWPNLSGIGRIFDPRSLELKFRPSTGTQTVTKKEMCICSWSSECISSHVLRQIKSSDSYTGFTCERKSIAHSDA